MPNHIEETAGSDCPEATCSAWIAVSERLPKVGRRVLVCCQYTERRLVTIAKWQPAKTIDGQFWDEYPEEWETENDITNPTDLWVEYPLEIEQCGFVENVTHWMPLPSLPNVKVMAHPLAGANVDRGVRVEISWEHRKQRG